MGKTRRYTPDGQNDYAPKEHRIPRNLLRRANWQIPRHIGSVVIPPEPQYKYELPHADEAGGIARDRGLDIIQTIAEQLVASMN